MSVFYNLFFDLGGGIRKAVGDDVMLAFVLRLASFLAPRYDSVFVLAITDDNTTIFN